MKHIGFIDYFLDEWHANNYPQWIRESIEKKGLDYELTYAWADIDKPGGLDSQSWCEKYDMTLTSSLEELVEKSDFIIVLSPDHPEHHERLSELALKSGKPIYIDKTFAPDREAAIRIFDLAGEYDTPMFSSSALRYSDEIMAYRAENPNQADVDYVATTGSGEFASYSIHQLEMIVALMGTGVKRIKSLSRGGVNNLIMEYTDGRIANMLQMDNLPFQLSMKVKAGDVFYYGDASNIFQNLIDVILDFFENPKAPVLREETIEIITLIDCGKKALESYDTWIEL